MSDFIREISAIGAEFKEMFTGIPSRFPVVAENLPIAVIGILVVMLELALIAIMILLVSKLIRFFENRKSKKSAQPESEVTAATAATGGTPLPETVSQGTLELVETDEATAAVIMAIVSDETGIPLNRLNFKSIKLVEGKD